MPPKAARTSTHSQSSQNYPEPGLPGAFPDAEARRNGSDQQSFSEAVHARRAEFSRPQTIRIKVSTWNVGGKRGAEEDIARWFVKGEGASGGSSDLEVPASSHSLGKSVTGSAQEVPNGGTHEQGERKTDTKNASTVPEPLSGVVPHGDDIGLYVLGLQEIVDVSSAAEALRPYTDPTAANKWKQRIEAALPSGYKLVAQQQLIGLVMFIYASPVVAPQISSVSTTSCGTGLAGIIGNKGAVTTRIVLGETTRLAFINSHLSSGFGKNELVRRNWDAAQIVSRTQYEPIEDSLGHVSTHREKIGDEDFAFWFGDLNYRLEGIPGDDVRRLLMLHTRNEYDISRQQAYSEDEEGSVSTPSVDSVPAIEQRDELSTSSKASSTTSSSTISSPEKSSFERTSSSLDSNRTSVEGLDEPLDPRMNPVHLQTTLDSLLSHDELHNQQKERKAFHDGWREGPITFLPTYKYDVGSVGVFDTGDKKRGPSWCDRILYRTRKDKADYENMIMEEQHADQKDTEYAAKGMDEAAEESMLYDYDPEADGDEIGQNDSGFATGDNPIGLNTQEGCEDLIQLEYYVSHQEILSSDHKPLDTVFRLEYDAVIPELKSKVHQEVVRDLDRVENENRPAVALIPDNQANGDGKAVEAIDFGSLCFEDAKTQTITLANIGREAAVFGFLSQRQEKSQTMSPTPEWLDVSIATSAYDDERGASEVPKNKGDGEWSRDVPQVYTLEPGCTSTIECIAKIDSIAMARDLNRNNMLEEVLILRVKDGRDHFLPIRGTWERTSLGSSISELVRVPEGGIRKFLRAVLPGAVVESAAKDRLVTTSAPKEVFRLTQMIETLSERILAEWNMIESNTTSGDAAPWTKSDGWPFEGWTLNTDERTKLRIPILEALDTAKPFDEVLSIDKSPLHRLEAFAGSFLLFLEALSDGVVTEELWSELVSKCFTKDRTTTTKASRDEERAAMLEVLSASSAHSATFILITSMLGSLVQEVSNTAQEDRPKEVSTATKLFTRRRTLSADPKADRKQRAQRKYAALFADILVRSPEQIGAKAKSLTSDRKREFIEVFLESGGTDG